MNQTPLPMRSTILPNPKTNFTKTPKPFHLNARMAFAKSLKPFRQNPKTYFAKSPNTFCRSQPITKTIHSHNFVKHPKHFCRNLKPILPKPNTCLPNSKIIVAKTEQPCFKLALGSNTPKHNSTSTACLHVYLFA